MKHIVPYLFFVLFLAGNLTLVLGQVKTDTLTIREAEKLQKKFDKELKKGERINTFNILPVVYYTPETRLGFGLVAKYSFKFNQKDTLLKFSQILPSAIYTLNKQVMLSVAYELNYNRNWFSRGQVGYFIYPYFFAGIGNDHNATDVEWYGAKYPVFEADLYRNVLFKGLSFGIRYRFQKTAIDSVLSGGLLETEKVFGSAGSTQSSLGLGGIYNSTDYLLSPTKGWYVDVNTMWAGTGIGASYTDQLILADIRKYISVFKKKDVLAFQAYGEFHTGEIPFNLMPLLGGSKRMRGYREGVFRDRQMMVLQAEYRSRLFFKYFGFVIFGNAGGIGDEIYEVSRNLKYTYGAGLRFTPIPKQRYFVRFDYARNEETQGFYIEIGQAF